MKEEILQTIEEILDIKGKKFEKQIKEEIDKLATKIKKRENLDELVDRLNNLLFFQEKYSYCEKNFFIDDVLKNKSGNCLGLSFLYFVVSNLINIPSNIVTIRSHVLIRINNSYLEMSEKGKNYSINYFLKKFKVPHFLIGRLYFYPLNKKEIKSLFYNRIGAEYQKKGNYIRAEENYNKAIELNPKNILAYYNKGNICVIEKRYKEALENYLKIISFDPYFPEVYYNIAYIFWKIGESKKGIKIIKNSPLFPQSKKLKNLLEELKNERA